MQALRRQIAKYEWSKPKCDLATEYVGIVQNNVGIRAYGELESRAAHITWHQRHCSMAVCSCLGWRLAEDILRSWFVLGQAIACAGSDIVVLCRLGYSSRLVVVIYRETYE